MKTRITKTSLITAASLAGLIGIIAVLPSNRSQAQVGVNLLGPADVRVVNSPSVTVTGTPAVRIANDTPVRVLDAALEAKKPIQFRVKVVVDNFGIGIQPIYSVPAGKRLSIEHVALKTSLLENGTFIHADILIGPVGSEFDHPLSPVIQERVDQTQYIINHPILAFADRGAEIRVRAILIPGFAEGRDGLVALEGTLSGYLENAP
jgi:hypothetical protein